jgi:hypothetical protein
MERYDTVIIARRPAGLARAFELQPISNRFY